MQGGVDVPGLGAFVAARQKNDELAPALLEIHPITGAVVDPQFRDAFADWLDVAGVSSGEPFDSCLDSRSRLDVAQAIEPQCEDLGLANFDHVKNVALRLQVVKDQ